MSDRAASGGSPQPPSDGPAAPRLHRLCDRIGRGSCQHSCERTDGQRCDHLGTQVGWLTQDHEELPVTGGGEPPWLGPAERDRLAGLSIPKRQRDFLLGRWTAKRALAATLWPLTPPAAALELRAAADGAPEAFLDGQPLPLHVSISHSAGRALAVVRPMAALGDLPMAASAAPNAAAIGADLEHLEPRSQLLVDDFFTADERARVAASPAEERDALISLIWSAKESALKALRCGLREDPRHLQVQLTAGFPLAGSTGTWHPLHVHLAASLGRAHHLPGRILTGWWSLQHPFVLTIVGHELILARPPVALASWLDASPAP